MINDASDRFTFMWLPPNRADTSQAAWVDKIWRLWQKTLSNKQTVTSSGNTHDMIKRMLALVVPSPADVSFVATADPRFGYLTSLRMVKVGEGNGFDSTRPD
jgi:hypothetical protein